MCAEQNKDEEAIYYAAISKRPEERKAYMKAACGDDAELLARVEALLKAHEVDDSFLKKPALGSEVTLAASALTEGPGTAIGQYKLLQLIGEGGFGCVYMADQQEPVRRRVALKIIKLGMDTKQVIGRFEAERQALAMMDHPNIARVLDAGATDTGRPYFVMELVKGIPITEYCDKNNLDARQRLELFIDVCKAVQHAHQKGIIHRDIKPSNVMITLHDGKPVPKIIDFGIAKATQHRLTEKTFFTEYKQFIGTPEYMSPEQAEMSGLDVDTRTDIYSLGVLLYELLTGTTPFERQRLLSAAYDEIRRIICETDPPKPSVRLSTLGAALTDVAKHRHVQPDQLCKIVRGDLDWVVMKALEKDRTRRYETANELAADINRHLGDEPVSAGPPSVVYRLKKFVRRHRASVTGIAAVLVVLVAGIVVSTIFAIGQARARFEAELRAMIDESMISYIRAGLLAKGPEATIGEVVDNASKNLEERFQGKVRGEAAGRRLLLEEAASRQWVGNMYSGLGLYEEAEPHLERALRLFRDELGEEHRFTLSSMYDLALLYLRQGRYAKADPLFAKVLQTSRRVLDKRDPLNWHYMGHLAWQYLMQGRFDAAEPLLIKALETQRRVLGEEHPSTLGTMRYLGILYIEQARYDEAETLVVKTLETKRRVLGEEDKWTLCSISDLGILYRKQKRYDEAESLFEKALEIARRVLGEGHWLTPWCVQDLGLLYCEQGRYDEAEALLAKGLETSRRELGEEHRLTLWFMKGLGLVYCGQSRYDEAEELLVKALEGRRHVLGGEVPFTLDSMNDLAVLYREQGRYEKAEQLFAKSLASRRRILGDEHPDTLTSMGDLALLYLKQGRYDEAEPLATACYTGRNAKFGPEHVFTEEAIQVLVKLYKAWDRPEEAEKWRKKLSGQKAAELP